MVSNGSQRIPQLYIIGRLPDLKISHGKKTKNKTKEKQRRETSATESYKGMYDIVRQILLQHTFLPSFALLGPAGAPLLDLLLPQSEPHREGHPQILRALDTAMRSKE